MISLFKLNILTILKELPKNVRELGKLIVAKDWKVAQSGHTARAPLLSGKLQFPRQRRFCLPKLFNLQILCSIFEIGGVTVLQLKRKHKSFVSFFLFI